MVGGDGARVLVEEGVPSEKMFWYPPTCAVDWPQIDLVSQSPG